MNGPRYRLNTGVNIPLPVLRGILLLPVMLLLGVLPLADNPDVRHNVLLNLPMLLLAMIPAWLMLEAQFSLRVTLTPGGLTVTQTPFRLYRYNKLMPLESFRWEQVQSAGITSIKPLPAAARVRVIAITLRGGRTVMLPFESNRPRFPLLTPETAGTPDLVTAVRRYCPFPVTEQPESPPPETLATRDIGKPGEYWAMASVGVFVAGLLLMIASQAHFLDSSALYPLMGGAGLCAAMAAAMHLRHSPVKAAIPVIALLAAATTAYATWSALLWYTQATGTPRQVAFEAAGNGPDDYLQSRDHTPTLTLHIVGDSLDRQFNRELPKTVTVHTGPFGIRTMSQADYRRLLAL